ncbi:hypothetical protein RV06_GL001527 [Enterococcus haemoperoxidus]|nr:hypothetical protein RV06_GL001527 [Enterococcus haemoperoxidus]
MKEGQEFYYYKNEEGIISLIPKATDFFLMRLKVYACR